MFNNTNEFFEKVAGDFLPNIDIENYIRLISEDYNSDHLVTIQTDLKTFTELYIEELRRDIWVESLYHFFTHPIRKKLTVEELKMVQLFQKECRKMGSNNIKGVNFWKRSLRKYALSLESKKKALEKMEDLYDKLDEQEIKDRIDNRDEVNTTLLDNYVEKVTTIYINYKTKNLQKLSCLINEKIEEKTKPNKDPKHKHIFANDGFKLFDYIMKKYVDGKDGRYELISFFYWKMYNDDNHYIHQRPERFKYWFLNESDYKEKIGKLKSETQLSQKKDTERNASYSEALDWFRE